MIDKSESMSSTDIYSMESRASPFFGCFVFVSSRDGGEPSTRESRFHLFADSLSQLSLLIQSMYNASPPNCLIISDNFFRRRFVKRRNIEELTAVAENYVQERKNLYREFIKKSAAKEDTLRDEDLRSKLTEALKAGHDVRENSGSLALTCADVAVLRRRNSELSRRFDPLLHSLISSLDDSV